MFMALRPGVVVCLRFLELHGFSLVLNATVTSPRRLISDRRQIERQVGKENFCLFPPFSLRSSTKEPSAEERRYKYDILKY